MVVTKIYGIYGVCLTKKELYDMLNRLEDCGLEYEHDYLMKDMIYELNNLEGPDIELFNRECCTAGTSLEDAYILGVKIDTIWRSVMECENCRHYQGMLVTNCNECHDTTQYGHYPIMEIARNLTTFTIDNVCRRCGHCHAESIYEYEEDLESQPCERCNARSKRGKGWFRGPNFGYLQTEWLKRETGKDHAFYFMTNDCVSCS